MVLLFPLPLAWLLSPGDPGSALRKISDRVLSVAVCLLMGLILLLTKSRGGYIAAAVGGLMVMWLSVRRRWASVLILVLSLVVIGMGVWLLFGTKSQTPDLVEGATDPSTWVFRQQVWRTVLWMMADFPFTGVGMGSFNDVASLLYALYVPQNPGAHNLYFQVGVDLGIPGMIAYIAVLMLTLWMAGSAMREFTQRGDGTLRVVAVGAMSGMVALMVHGGADHTVWNTRAAFIPWVVMGLVVGLHGLEEREDGGEKKSKYERA
ncbi:MAG: O-antigen ligase family protein, partial [Anaerolineae bacterium]